MVKNQSTRMALWWAGGIALAVILIFGIRYVAYALSSESTDDAFIEAHVTPISPKVAGQVVAVPVNDNQDVKEGDLLVEIDPRDYEARFAQARAALDGATAQHKVAQINLEKSRLQLTSVEADAAQAAAQVTAAEAQAVRADADWRRARELLQTGAIAQQDFDGAQATSRSANADLEAARRKTASDEALVAEAQEQLAHDQAQIDLAATMVEQAQAAARLAELQLSYTKILAPRDGRVTERSVERGGYVQEGQILLALVPRDVWVVANFKESQLTHMRPGQPAAIRVDAYPGVRYRGHVDSIQAGSGARFSLLPPENAVGNYVKVVQRVPVKIVFDALPDDGHLLGPGMSVMPMVQVESMHAHLVLLVFIVVMTLGALFVVGVVIHRFRNRNSQTAAAAHP
jgi:membrane fusion protein (multidrug efflux system)